MKDEGGRMKAEGGRMKVEDGRMTNEGKARSRRKGIFHPSSFIFVAPSSFILLAPYSFILLLAALAFGGCKTVGVSMTEGGYAEVSPPVANEMMLDSRQVVILDVRSSEIFSGPNGHIAGALSVPFETIEKQLPELLPYQDDTVLVYGDNATDGAVAAKLLTVAGFRHVVHISGGLDAWIERGYRTVNAQ